MCSQECGHCPYPRQFLEPIPSARKLRRILRDAVQRRAVGVELSCGQGIAQHPAIMEVCHHYGLDSFLDYLEMTARCVEQMALGRRAPLIPSWDLGPLSLAEMRRLRPVLLSLRLSLESVDPTLRGKEIFRGAPAKRPRWQIEVLDNAGHARIPVVAVCLVGIGEPPGSVEKTLSVLAELQHAHGNIQAVCVRGFKPHPRTLMAQHPPVEKRALLEAVSMARRILPSDVSVQVQAVETPEWTLDLIEAGADDLGDIPLHGSIEQWKAVEEWECGLAQQLARQGIHIEYRLPLYPSVIGKGLYPITLEARLNRALSAVQNGASPKHAEVVAEAVPETPVKKKKNSKAPPGRAGGASGTATKSAKNHPR